jgi:hypothetical protein
VALASQVSLWVALVSIATAFGNLHRYGSVDLLLVLCLLMGLWVVSSLMAAPLRYGKSWVNLLVWSLLGLVLLQVSPLPAVSQWAGRTDPGPAAGLLSDSFRDFFHAHSTEPWAGRFSLRPVATSGVLILAASAAALYWLLAASLTGRSGIRIRTWAVALGLAPLALWGVLSGLENASAASPEGVFRAAGPVLILGGDSLVPALLAAMPLSLAAVLRLLGWLPHRHHYQRQSRWGWLARAAPVWAAIGLILVGLMAVALGMSNVPVWLLVACVLLSVGLVLFWYATLSGPSFRLRRVPILFSVGVIVWIALGLVAGGLIGPPRQPAAGGDAGIGLILDSLSGPRAALGVGAGAISPREIFGAAGWPQGPGEDRDTNGYLVLRAELGWVGLALILVLAVAVAASWLKAWRRAVSPWPRLMMLVGLGVLAANLLYFRFDASALLAPNLLALAAVGGIVTAWAGHGAGWREDRARDFRPAHWPLVIGAVGLIAALALAEGEMLSATPSHDFLSDKALHFGAFGVISLLLCYALGPRPGRRLLTTRVAAAVAVAVAMALGLEYAQRYLTANRQFEMADWYWGSAGAGLMGAWWWAMRRAGVLEASPEPPAPPEPGVD